MKKCRIRMRKKCSRRRGGKIKEKKSSPSGIVNMNCIGMIEIQRANLTVPKKTE